MTELRLVAGTAGQEAPRSAAGRLSGSLSPLPPSSAAAEVQAGRQRAARRELDNARLLSAVQKHQERRARQKLQGSTNRMLLEQTPYIFRSDFERLLSRWQPGKRVPLPGTLLPSLPAKQAPIAAPVSATLPPASFSITSSLVTTDAAVSSPPPTTVLPSSSSSSSSSSPSPSSSPSSSPGTLEFLQACTAGIASEGRAKRRAKLAMAPRLPQVSSSFCNCNAGETGEPPAVLRHHRMGGRFPAVAQSMAPAQPASGVGMMLPVSERVSAGPEPVARPFLVMVENHAFEDMEFLIEYQTVNDDLLTNHIAKTVLLYKSTKIQFGHRKTLRFSATRIERFVSVAGVQRADATFDEVLEHALAGFLVHLRRSRLDSLAHSIVIQRTWPHIAETQQYLSSTQTAKRQRRLALHLGEPEEIGQMGVSPDCPPPLLVVTPAEGKSQGMSLPRFTSLRSLVEPSLPETEPFLGGATSSTGAGRHLPVSLFPAAHPS